MRLVRDLHAKPLSSLGATASVVTIGNFDGLHRGHQALLNKVLQDSGSACSTLVTFEPLPQQFFSPDSASMRLQQTAGKLRMLRSLGVDLVWMLRFNAELATLSADRFVRQVLVEGLRAVKVVVGEDFRYGHKRAGDTDSLSGLGRKFGFTVEVVPAIRHDGRRISSSRIRDLLTAGRLDEAAILLGRPYSMAGPVIKGRQLGRSLGFPTANLRVHRQPGPLNGIFAVRCRVSGIEGLLDGVASIGYRPTVGGEDFLLEVHLFNFDGDLYRRRMQVEFIARLRDEEKFDSLEVLVEQMQQDASQARAILSKT